MKFPQDGLIRDPAAAPAQPPMSIRKTALVQAPQRQAFELFTRGQAQWWPPAGLPQPAPTVVLECRLAGRWFERGLDRSECTWGRVLAWAPPHSLVLSWQIGANGEFDPALQTELDLHFAAHSEGSTLISLEHRHLDRFGAEAESQRALLASELGWAGILERFAQHCERVHALA